MTSISPAIVAGSVVSPSATSPKTSVTPSDQQPSSSSAAGAQASPQQASQQQAALKRLLTKYSYDQAHGADANTIAALGKQIQAAAKALGQHVTLPRAPTTAPAADADSSQERSAENSTSSSGKLDVTA